MRPEPDLAPLFANALSQPEAIALADGESTLTWSQLAELVRAGARALAEEVVNRRAGVFAPNSIETIVVHLCALHAGISLVPINPQLSVEEASWQIADGEAAILFTCGENAWVAQEAAEKAGCRQVVVWGASRIDAALNWVDWISRAPEGALDLGRPALPFLHYTSGTTGRPKATETPPVMFPRGLAVGGLLEHLKQVGEGFPPGPVLLLGPSYHTGPMTSVRELAGGRPMVVMRRFEPERALELIERFRIAMVVMVPTHFQRLLALPDEVRGRYDISSLTFVPHTGAACPIEVKRRMIDWFGPVLIEGYGGTECGTTCIITAEDWLRKPGSVGQAVAPFEVLVLGEDGQPLPAGEVGRLCFRNHAGDGIEYHNDPEKSAAAYLAPGVFTLGEVGYIDTEGFVFITDRIADLVVSGGVNIYPAEIEQALLLHPSVADVAVIGVPDADLGEVTKALIVARPGSTMSCDGLLAFLKDRIARYKIPRSIEFVPSVGRSVMGKLNKRELRRPFWPTGRTIGG